MNELGSDIKQETNEYLIFKSICHDSESNKLYYYTSSKYFFCYSNCHSMSIYDVIMKSKKCNFKDAFNLLKNIIGNMDRPFVGFGENEVEYKSLDELEVEELEPIKKQYLYNTFKNIPIREWLEEGISERAMAKYKIRYDDIKDRVIIPHFNTNDKCIGIRVRNFNPIEEKKGKYIPLWHDCIGYNHPLGKCLYGLNISKENIKKYKKVIVFESEKSVLKYESIYPNNNLSVAICGSNFSNVQKKILLNLFGTDIEIILCLDKQYKVDGDEESIQWKEKILRNLENIKDIVKCSYTWCTDDSLDYKDSPIDKSKKVFESLIKNRITIE